jgi:cytochrome c553
MKTASAALATLLTLSLFLCGSATAAPRDDILRSLDSAARAADPAFTGFSAARGQTLHTQAFAGGKADTPACTACHGATPRSSGRTPAGKAVEPMALSLSPSRYSDAAKVDKWFTRNCRDVLGRECTPREKGDWLSFMFSQ